MMFIYAVLILSLLLVTGRPFLIEGPSSVFPGSVDLKTSVPQEAQEVPWSEMTVIKTHYDCRGVPMLRETSKIKTRAGDSPVVKTSTENLDVLKGASDSNEAPLFFHSMRSRIRTVRPASTQSPLARTTLTTPSPGPSYPQHRTGPGLLEVGPDRIIDTPFRGCPDGYEEDYHGKCRFVFPEPPEY